MKEYKAFIRVVKSKMDDIDKDCNFYQIKEPLIYANDKKEVKEFIFKKYPNFFQNGKVYEKESKDPFQFFYVVIFELFQYEKELIKEGSWVCKYCKQEHINQYIDKPIKNIKLLGGDHLFCSDYCCNKFIEYKYKQDELGDDLYYINYNSPTYIYKITEKTTNKCYIGKTKNQPFSRWWNHWSYSQTPFDKYLKTTKISDWIFEVIKILPPDLSNKEIFEIESQYITENDSINKGFNSLISYRCKK